MSIRGKGHFGVALDGAEACSFALSWSHPKIYGSGKALQLDPAYLINWLLESDSHLYRIMNL